MSYSFSKRFADHLINERYGFKGYMHTYISVSGIRKLIAVCTYNLRIPHTICGFRLQLWVPQQLNLAILMSSSLFVDSKNCSGFSKLRF